MKFYPVIAISFCYVSLTSAADYFPLSVGFEWRYNWNNETTLVKKVESSQQVDNGTMFNVSFNVIYSDSIREILLDSLGESDSSFLLADAFRYSSGNDVFYMDSMSQIEPIRKCFEHNPQVNNTWDNETGRGPSIIIYSGEVSVPAGTFQSCFALVELGSHDTTWYAPDVGEIAQRTTMFGYQEMISFKKNNSPILTERSKIDFLNKEELYHANRKHPYVFN